VAEQLHYLVFRAGEGREALLDFSAAEEGGNHEALHGP